MSGRRSTAISKGDRFGRLLVICPSGTNHAGHALWHCECDCGGYSKTSSRDLLTGHTKSCGCLAAEAHKVYGKRRAASINPLKTYGDAGDL